MGLWAPLPSTARKDFEAAASLHAQELGRKPVGGPVSPKRLAALSHAEERCGRNHPPGPLRRLLRAAKSLRRGRS